MPDRHHRLPISTRHAFALAFELAARRDPLQSLVVPVLLRAPWVLTLALLPLEGPNDPSAVLALGSLALIGDFITLLVVGAMLRFRARSVFNLPAPTRPGRAAECYARGFSRIPWLLLTEVVRNTVLAIAAYCSFLPTAYLRLSAETFFGDLAHNFLQLAVAASLLAPTLFLGFRLAVATEAVVLDERDMGGAFQRSFRMMRGRFERWFELVAASGALILGLAMLVAALGVLFPTLSDAGRIALFWLLVIAATPIIQYAWTFFYLRLAEIEEPLVEVGPMLAKTPVEARPSEPTAAASAGSQGEDGHNGATETGVRPSG
jgi:hypothetical protein